MKKDLTKGNPLTLILMFAFPMFLSNLFQQVYNLTDMAIVSHILGDHALSSIGAVSIIYGLITSLCFGMCTGYSILISQYFGAGNERKTKKTIAMTVELSVISSAVMTLMSVLLLKKLMHLINVSDALFEDGYSYIIVIVSGLSISIFYNMFSSVLRALGNSKVPLIFLIISSLLNVGLDIWFIGGLGLGIAGAAYATLLAQCISVILCAYYVIRYCKDILPDKEDYSFDNDLVMKMLGSGIAMALMYAIVNIGSVILQSGINSFSDDTVAAHTTARKISEICMMPVATIASTMTTYCGQNFGAGKMDRVLKGVKLAHIIGFIWSTLAIAFIYIFGDMIVRLLTGTDNITIIDTAKKYLRVDLLFYYALVILCVLRCSLQGIGRRGITVFGSVLEMAGKIIAVLFFVVPFGYDAIILCEPVIWVVCCIPVGIAFFTDKNVKPILFNKTS